MNKRTGVALVIAAGLGAIGFVAYRWRTYGFDWRQFIHTIAGVDFGWMAVSLILILTTYIGRALRWEVMARPLSKEARFLPILSATCIGFAAVVLFGRAGEPVRPYLISRRMGVAFSTQVAAWVVERILDLLMILVIFGIALTQIGQASVRPGPRIEAILQTAGATAGIVGVICLALLLGLQRFRGNVQSRLLGALEFLPHSALLRVRSFFGAFAEGMQATRRKSFAAELMAYTILEWGIIAGSFFCLFRATPATMALTFTDTIIVLGFVTLGSVVQIPGVGGGMQVVTVLVLTEFYGIGLEAASGVALLWWVIGFVTIVPIGLLAAFFEGIKWRTLKNIAAEDEIDSEHRDLKL